MDLSYAIYGWYILRRRWFEFIVKGLSYPGVCVSRLLGLSYPEIDDRWGFAYSKGVLRYEDILGESNFFFPFCAAKY